MAATRSKPTPKSDSPSDGAPSRAGKGAGAGAGGGEEGVALPGRVLVGVDLVDVARMERALERTPSLRGRLFTADERRYCDRQARPALNYAARFAAREAVLKALGTGFRGMGLADVSVTLDEAGRPSARLAGRAAERAAELGVVEVALSLTHTADVACANAVLITEASRPEPAPAKSVDALDLSFRDARSIVLDLEAALKAERPDADDGRHVTDG